MMHIQYTCIKPLDEDLVKFLRERTEVPRNSDPGATVIRVVLQRIGGTAPRGHRRRQTPLGAGLSRRIHWQESDEGLEQMWMSRLTKLSLVVRVYCWLIADHLGPVDVGLPNSCVRAGLLWKLFASTGVGKMVYLTVTKTSWSFWKVWCPWFNIAGTGKKPA